MQSFAGKSFLLNYLQHYYTTLYKWDTVGGHRKRAECVPVRPADQITLCASPDARECEVSSYVKKSSCLLEEGLDGEGPQAVQRRPHLVAAWHRHKAAGRVIGRAGHL